MQTEGDTALAQKILHRVQSNEALVRNSPFHSDKYDFDFHYDSLQYTRVQGVKMFKQRISLRSSNDRCTLTSR